MPARCDEPSASSMTPEANSRLRNCRWWSAKADRESSQCVARAKDVFLPLAPAPAAAQAEQPVPLNLLTRLFGVRPVTATVTAGVRSDSRNLRQCRGGTPWLRPRPGCSRSGRSGTTGSRPRMGRAVRCRTPRSRSRGRTGGPSSKRHQGHRCSRRSPGRSAARRCRSPSNTCRRYRFPSRPGSNTSAN
jgi:hypothetical protein